MKKGWTLIELVMLITIAGILAGIGALLTIELIDSFEFSLYRKDLSAAAEVVLKRMTREMPRLQNNSSVITAGAGTYRFVDIDGRIIQFALNGGNLERYDGTNTDVLAAAVSSLVFTYLDGNMAVIATPLVNPDTTDIKFVQIDLTLSAGNNTINYTALVGLQNVIQEADLFL